MEQDSLDFEIGLLLEAIFFRYKDDFRRYSKASIRRRVSLALQSFQLATVSQLQNRIMREPELYKRLLHYLTVPTSEMFRDPSFFKALRTEVCPVLRTYPSLKIWIAGCSTGEELYSLAILLKEEDLLDRTIMYATDINPTSLHKAQTGVFSLDQIQLFTSNYQKSGGTKAFNEYYVAAYDRAIFNQSLKANVAFADHNLATDSVFSEVQLILCRNVLIYFNRELQDRVLNLFKDSLSRRGFLGLGSKESLTFSSVEHGFEEVLHPEKIYRERGGKL